MSKFIIIFLTGSFFFFILNIICLKKNLFIDNIYKSDHKHLTNKINVPITGGFLVIFSIIFFFKDIELVNKFFFILIFLLGLLSDVNKLTSPKIRFFVQILIVITYLLFNQLYISEIRINFFDNYFLGNLFFKLIFTTFCILILINGSNFIDGVNTLNSGYYLIILFNIFFLISIHNIEVEKYNLSLLIIILIIFFISNLFSKSFLGDSGSYLLSFYVAIFFINLSIKNPIVSPYYIVVLLWYPAFENFFTLSRRLIFEKNKIKNADNLHLHHLLYSFLKNKFDNKFTNTVTGIIINLFNLFIVLLSNNYLYQTQRLILILFSAILTYMIIYFLLKKNLKKHKIIS